MEYIVPRFRATYTYGAIRGGRRRRRYETARRHFVARPDGIYELGPLGRLNYYPDFTKSRGMSNHVDAVPSFTPARFTYAYPPPVRSFQIYRAGTVRSSGD